ncbi:hypothetical protein K469DRAFT_807586 [Zopfia rhizophila CBS 207.26]|uniref:Uncharacterized protein n=1 Tax=Zopfia rhizophila CBS 207.26 TaxID=1314779 RepID=A0A6A6DGC2_9PEZI|nr:hypothetical protein K469DRAFT_807586 [Zopfia rhizophila CBS 207.26]
MSLSYGVDNFLDTKSNDAGDGGSQDRRSPVIRRPWKDYWPPKEGDDLWKWLSSECPEALTWRFDPTNPFNRPWHKWNKVAASKGWACLSFVLRVDGTDNLAENTALRPASDDRVEILHRELDKTDELIKRLHLTSVTPNEFNYLAGLETYRREKPYYSRLPLVNGLKRTNVIGQSYGDVKIFDVTGSEHAFQLEQSSFEYVKVPVHTKEWSDVFVREEYLPSMVEWLRIRFDCKKVHIYAYNVTASTHKNGQLLLTLVSADVTSNSSISRLKLHLSMKNPDRRKYRFIAMWRPLTVGRTHCPLALCAFKTVGKEDLVKSDIVFPHYCDESYEVKYNPSHRWFFKSDMSPDDVVLFNLFDPTPGNATFCVHSAFEDPTVQNVGTTRRSVELRAILEI